MQVRILLGAPPADLAIPARLFLPSPIQLCALVGVWAARPLESRPVVSLRYLRRGSMRGIDGAKLA